MDFSISLDFSLNQGPGWSNFGQGSAHLLKQSSFPFGTLPCTAEDPCQTRPGPAWPPPSPDSHSLCSRWLQHVPPHPFLPGSGSVWAATWSYGFWRGFVIRSCKAVQSRGELRGRMQMDPHQRCGWLHPCHRLLQWGLRRFGTHTSSGQSCVQRGVRVCFPLPWMPACFLVCDAMVPAEWSWIIGLCLWWLSGITSASAVVIFWLGHSSAGDWLVLALFQVSEEPSLEGWYILGGPHPLYSAVLACSHGLNPPNN